MQHAKNTCCPLSTSMPVDFERRRAAAEQPAAFEELHAGARILQFERGRQAREPGADDRYPLLLSHDLTTTRSFSVFDKAARSRNGRPGIALDLLEQFFVDAGHRMDAGRRPARDVSQHLVPAWRSTPRARST